jgi:hypothetical protein
MTIAIAWVRRVDDYEELLFVADSRLSGDGRVFDYCPKLSVTASPDCALGFAGYSGNGYPLMQQMGNAIAAYRPARDGAIDLVPLKTHLIKVMNEVASSVVRDLLLEGGHASIGGAPQLLKVHQHRNVSATAIFWPSRERPLEVQPYLLGRPLLTYERSDVWVLNPYTFRLVPDAAADARRGEEAALSFARQRLVGLLKKHSALAPKIG